MHIEFWKASIEQASRACISICWTTDEHVYRLTYSDSVYDSLKLPWGTGKLQTMVSAPVLSSVQPEQAQVHRDAIVRGAISIVVYSLCSSGMLLLNKLCAIHLNNHALLFS
jgi:hypothetical protein